jgi:hypothetical protein
MQAAVEKPTTRSKVFRVAVEGATTDGRTLPREWIAQMAKNYNPQRYGARVNLEHIRGYAPPPASPFGAYGDVLALEAREETDGPHQGKLGLYAQIDPTTSLVDLTKARQKIYTSIEVAPSFADTKEAYMVGLAVTDSPASLGTEVLSFAAQNPAAHPFASRKQAPDNLFTAAVEAVIEFESASASPDAGLFSRVKALLNAVKGKDASDASRFADVTLAVEALATHSADTAATVGAFDYRVTALETLCQALTGEQARSNQAFDALQQQLSSTGNGQPDRPVASGQATAAVTDC